MAFYESGGTPPMTLSQLITYVWLMQMFLALINQFTKDEELFKIIREGSLSYELTRPKHLYFLWYFKLLGFANVLLRFFPLLVVTILLPEPYCLSLPASFSHFCLFLLSLIMGALLVVSLVVLYPIICLHTLNEKGLVAFIITLGDLLSGLVVPIPFFPKFLQIISSFLPFQYISDLPFRIYVGNISLEDGIYGIFLQFMWMIIMIGIGNLLLQKSIKKVVIQGG